MRSVFASALLLLTFAGSITAHGHHRHHEEKRHAKKQARAWGRRDVAGVTLASSAVDAVLTAVPSVVTGEVTISNTAPASPAVTAPAVGADRGDTSVAPACSNNGGFGDYCDLSSGLCCGTGLTCDSNLCERLCTAAVTEPYCDTNSPCDSTLGYVCTKNRCRPPAGAMRVPIGATCDQGGANTLFCIPTKAICVDSVCEVCTQHS